MRLKLWVQMKTDRVAMENKIGAEIENEKKSGIVR